ncbi:hypothetical protein CLAFUW4_14789 [Fulvia fulva]|uniref:Uncharacterized protein n=1 Tax=Passalora fulva TaxID=5499 RepID=A0A9Q8UWV8_PASFU|nr:uncharacterized protein CLAFUR5_14614 [Fulvia fulva]KAK4609395.1 hypothetical protein CLAFUR4_14781 [Fulvia fulva]KAK4609821.1 hypothetical protein CLAFUR0_14781 [Fulvia fulva]UJO25302.1 hypothetical protein CLAFUR5_14614 [Fulvia fulva]WPV22431.1 hypothetical protein CLAFUW4_14789 [Fulvia fulva]WPV37825.1 hypothetical protein CLAFUW7_14790 [Fulvia fulva]
MDQLRAALSRSTLSENKKVDWSFDHILRSFPTEICHLIAENRQPPTKQPVDVAINHGRLKDSMVFLNGCNTPPELHDFFRKAYYKNTTFQLHVRNSKPPIPQRTLSRFLDQVGDNIKDLTTLRINHIDFSILITLTHSRYSTSIDGTLEKPWRSGPYAMKLFEHIAHHKLTSAKTLIEAEIKENKQTGITRQQLATFVETICKLETVRYVIQRGWLALDADDEDELDGSLVPDDEELQGYVDLMDSQL